MWSSVCNQGEQVWADVSSRSSIKSNKFYIVRHRPHYVMTTLEKSPKQEMLSRRSCQRSSLKILRSSRLVPVKFCTYLCFIFLLLLTIMFSFCLSTPLFWGSHNKHYHCFVLVATQHKKKHTKPFQEVEHHGRKKRKPPRRRHCDSHDA